MKRIFAVILCVMLVFATPLVAYAEEAEPADQTTTAPVEETVTEEVEQTLPEKIVGFITENYTESSLLSLAVSVVVYLFYEIKKHRSLNGSIGVLNNNAVTVAENSAKAIKDMLGEAGKMVDNSSEGIKKVLAEAVEIADVVKGYKDDLAALLEEIRTSAEEKESLEATLKSVQTLLKTSKLATLELSNEVADLLVLANIPNSKKEELYSRHRAAVDAISTAEITEEIKDDGQET